MRRLPIYLLLDVSGSMRGTPIQAVRSGMEALITTLRSDPYALETAYISVITFNNEVNQIVPLTEVYKFQLPIIEAKFGTYLGKALKVLAEKIDQEVVKHTKENKGDWKPMVFIMSDGRSGDKIEKALNNIDIKALGNVIACAAGNNPNIQALHLITETIVQLHDMSSDTIKSFFKWVTASICTTSVKVTENPSEELMAELPPLPSGINLVKPQDLI